MARSPSLWQRLRTLQDKILSLDSLLLVGFRTASKFLMLVFVLLCARALGQESFGDFQFIDTATVQALQLLIVAAMVVTRIGCCFPAASRPNDLACLHGRAHAKVLLAACSTAVLAYLADAPVRAIFHVEAPYSISFAGVTVGAYLQFCYYLGILQVQERFRAIAVLFLLMGAVPLVILLPMYPDSISVSSAFAALAGGTLVAAGGGWLLVRASLPRSQACSTLELPSLRIVWVYLAAIGLFLAMHNLDIWATKFWLDRSQAGFYARHEFVGKIIFMISSSLALILFPKVGKAHERGKDPRSYLIRGLRGFTVLTLAFAVVVIGLFHIIAPLMFGTAMHSGLVLPALIVIAKSAQSLMFILVNYEAARGGCGMLPWLAAALAAEAALFALFGITPLTVAAATACVSVPAAGALFIHVWKNATKQHGCTVNTT